VSAGREKLWAIEQARALEAAQAAVNPPQPPPPAQGEPQAPHESPEAFLARQAAEADS
jgi:hypothetical protein